MDLSSLHILLTLDFIGDIAYGIDLHAISQGPDCRILQLFNIVLPEIMKCGLFPLRGKFAVLKKTRRMYRAIAELKIMTKKAVENARQGSHASDKDCSKRPSNKIYEILATCASQEAKSTFEKTYMVKQSKRTRRKLHIQSRRAL